MPVQVLISLFCGLLFTTASVTATTQDVHGNHLIYSLSSRLTFFQYGIAVDGAGDVDADGYDDVVVGSMVLVDVWSGRDGRILKTFQGLGNFGRSVSGAGDVNKDGFADIIIGNPRADNNGIGAAYVYSGKDWSLLHTFKGLFWLDVFGTSVNAAGDVDRDGHADVIVGAPQAFNGYTIGWARVFSGKNGRIIHTFTGDDRLEMLGFSVASAGDVNRDGYPDLIAGAPAANQLVGYARVYSGKDGAILRTLRGTSAIGEFGRSVSGAGDVNRDGHDDVIVGAHHDARSAVNAGSATVFSGKDWSVLHTFLGEGAWDEFGGSVTGDFDADGDGHADLAVGAGRQHPNNALKIGVVYVFSGKTGARLATFNAPRTSSWFGHALAVAGDVNRDGSSDLIVGAPMDMPPGKTAGAAQVISLRKLSLVTDTHELSVAGRWAQTFVLDAGPTCANHAYRIVGSASGTRPGFPVGSLTVPLNRDAYFDYALVNPNTPPLSGSMGYLDSAGTAQARFTMIPALMTPLVGLTVDHAYGLTQPRVGLVFVSNSVPLLFVP